MAAYSRRHYENVARVLGEIPGDPIRRDPVVKALADIFEKDNPMFDRDKFYERVVQIEKETENEVVKKPRVKVPRVRPAT